MIQDMTQGSPIRLLVFFSLPLLIGNVFQQFYNFADTMIVGRTIGYEALAAVGATGSVLFLVFGGFFGLTGGFAVITAQRFGAQDDDGVRRSVTTSAYLCTAITVIMTTVCVLSARRLLVLMRTPETILEDAVEYLTIFYLGMAALVFYNMLASIIRALGDSRTPLFFLIISTIINIALDLIFILQFGWGVAGAAWATVIAQAISAFLCLFYVFWRFPILRLHRHDWRFNWRFAWEHLRVALPMALQFMITALGVMVVQAALNGFGTEKIAGYTAGCRLDQLAVQPFFSFGMALATYVAQNYGAGNLERIRHGVNRCSILAVSFAVASGILIWVGCDWGVGLFIGGEQPGVIDSARTFLHLSASFYIVLALLFIYRNALQGMGRAFVPMMAGACELILRVAGAVWFAHVWGYTGVCLATPAAWIAATIPLGITYFFVIRKLRRNGITPPGAETAVSSCGTPRPAAD